MSAVFTPEERRFLDEQELGRLATVGRGGLPHVVPVSFQLNRGLGTIDVGGHGMRETRKFRHVVASGVAAFVADDVAPPYRPRSVEVRGRAEAVETEEGTLIRIWPAWVLARGLDGTPALRTRRVDAVPR